MKSTHCLIQAVILSMLMFVCPVLQGAGTYHGGAGTADNPYQILTAQHLMELGQHTEDYDDHFILLADIDMDPDIPGNQFWDRAPIAPNDNNSETFNLLAFSGTFDGNNKRIKNLNFSDPYTSHIGLFGKVNPSGTILNLGVDNAFVEDYHFDSYNVGFLVGENDGTLINCHATGRRFEESYYGYEYPENIGGLVGKNTGFIFDCYSGGKIIGGRNAGGLVGYNFNGYIHQCHSTCALIDCRNGTGGLVGRNEGPAVISYSYATGSVQAWGASGGLVGYSRGWNSNQKAIINRCYATGSVENGSGLVDDAKYDSIIKNSYSVGTVGNAGLIGSCYEEYRDVIHCFWDTDTSGSTGSDGGIGMNTPAMKQQQTFVDAGWDFDSTWEMIEGRTYPYFQWQGQEKPLEHLCKDSQPFPVGDLNSDCVVNFEDIMMLSEQWLVDVRR